jgi:putative phosphonate metabolism protein
MTPRYAIYYAPDPASALWQRASAWLGRDAVSGAELAQPAVAGLSAPEFASHTADPRHYGFHATLKAPFELADGASEPAMLEALAQIAAARRPFETDLSPQALGRFLAFRPAEPCPHIQNLHEDAVRTFEPFRAPLSDKDMARRRASGLTVEQDELLSLWGYPYVFGHFRFHMTLTGSIAEDALRQRLLEAAAGHFASDIGPHSFASVSLFKQADRSSAFTVIGSSLFLQQ